MANSNEDMKLYILLLTSGACISSGVVNFKSQPLTCDVRCDGRGAIRLISIKKATQQTETLLSHEAGWRMLMNPCPPTDGPSSIPAALQYMELLNVVTALQGLFIIS